MIGTPRPALNMRNNTGNLNQELMVDMRLFVNGEQLQKLREAELHRWPKSPCIPFEDPTLREARIRSPGFLGCRIAYIGRAHSGK